MASARVRPSTYSMTQKGRALVLAHVEDGHDGGMRQHAGGAGLTIKTRAVFLALRAFKGGGMDGFESHGAAHRGVEWL